MRISAVYARFFRSFNMDYLRMHHPSSRRFPWENIGDDWQPYVRVGLDPHITSVLGANEAGKTHLLDAIEFALTGSELSRSDFCRYSDYYAITQGSIRLPDLGLELRDFNEIESARIGHLLGWDGEEHDVLEVCYLFRENGNSVRIWTSNEATASSVTLSQDGVQELETLLPAVFKINSGTPLPVSIPITFLKNDVKTSQEIERPVRLTLLNMLEDEPALLQTSPVDPKDAQAIVSRLRNAMTPSKRKRITPAESLGRDLLLKVANIDPATFDELDKAIVQGHDGHVNGLIERINQAISTALNFPAMWAQDKDFQLLVTARDHDIVFTIRDRTGSQYSFEERSSGLRYFLSYYTQYLVHDPPFDRPEILLMDEPDAFLSNLGQQDLLKVLDNYASATTPDRVLQVVYVTHSPYLIDRNHAERVRVLEKGLDDEGTRVVHNASNNHYEPLRSALGSFVAETTFMGHANLMVEGTADQVILVGLSNYLRSQGSSMLETLDLNSTTIVPAGGAQHVPYLAYLARGRDIEKPAVVVLLDGDSEGDNAKKLLLRDELRGKLLLQNWHVLQIVDLLQLEKPPEIEENIDLQEIEDLIPLELAARAINRYLREFLGIEDSNISVADLKRSAESTRSVFEAVKDATRTFSISVDKIGFARCVVDELPSSGLSEISHQRLLHNFTVLLSELRRRLYAANEENQKDNLSKRLSREVRRFLASHPSGARKDEAEILFERLRSLLENDLQSDMVRNELAELQRRFIGSTNLTDQIIDFDKFRRRLEGIRYVPMLSTEGRDSDPERIVAGAESDAGTGEAGEAVTVGIGETECTG